MNESGLAGVLLEAVVISVGFMNSVISGKNYSRAINGHKVMAKSLERLLLDKYLETRCSKAFQVICCKQEIILIILLMRELQKTWTLQCKTKHMLIFLKNVLRSSNRSVAEAKVKLPNFG